MPLYLLSDRSGPSRTAQEEQLKNSFKLHARNTWLGHNDDEMVSVGLRDAFATKPATGVARTGLHVDKWRLGPSESDLSGMSAPASRAGTVSTDKCFHMRYHYCAAGGDHPRGHRPQEHYIEGVGARCVTGGCWVLRWVLGREGSRTREAGFRCQ